jgi:hypothetical protein
MTDAPMDRIAAVISPLRPFADEIVIAVDARVDPDLVAAHTALADRVVRVPYVPPVERSLAWLHAQCSCDWILRVDSDEIASTGFAARLPEHTNARDVTHYWIPRRWLFPDRATYLTDWPWLPDYQLRLVRNEPSLLRFPGTVHTSVTCLGPARYLTEPIYHLDCLVRSEEERAEKARLYNRLGNRVNAAGRSGPQISDVFYLPERSGAVARASVPPADRETLAADAGERFLARVSPSRKGLSRSATREEVDRFWSQRLLGAGAYAAVLHISDRELSVAAGELRTLDVDVTNRGPETWDWGPEATPPIHLSYELRSSDGQHVDWGPRTPMPAPARSGSTLRVPLLVQAPEHVGDYVLAVDLVHEHVRWFDVAVDVSLHVNEPADG